MTTTTKTADEKRFLVSVHYETSEGANGLNTIKTATAQQAAQAVIKFAAENPDYTVTEVFIKDFETYKKYYSTDADIQALKTTEVTVAEETAIKKIKTDINAKFKAGIKSQTIGVEIEFTGITRQKAAQAVANFLDMYVDHIGGEYDAYRIVDRSGRKWQVMSDCSVRGERKSPFGEVIRPFNDYPYKCEPVTTMTTAATPFATCTHSSAKARSNSVFSTGHWTLMKLRRRFTSARRWSTWPKENRGRFTKSSLTDRLKE